jgi:DNA-binding NtrC family response regulator
MKPCVLLVDDEPATRFGFSKFLNRAGYDTVTAATLGEAKQKLAEERFEAILLDMKLPDGNGLDWIKAIRPDNPDLPIVLITAHGDIPLAVEAMRNGADHFLTKPVNMNELDVFLRKSLELGALRRETRTSQRLKSRSEPCFGESPVMKTVLELVTLGAAGDTPILLYGETGTGKGVLAHWIHDHSARADAPFVEINCTSLKGDLLTSELFGHARGAFTSAVNEKQGLIDAADRGTLFLDEIGDMDMIVQSQFLKVIEEKQFRRLGEVKVRKSDFRLICATNKNLPDETEKGCFRKDLFFRINVFPIRLPPLRDRLQDMRPLIDELVRQFAKKPVEISPEVLELLSRYTWPGNIRELRNVLERAFLISHGEPQPRHFSELVSAGQGLGNPTASSVELERVEERHIQNVLRNFSGDTKKAAEALGISRAALYRKLEKYRTKSGA